MEVDLANADFSGYATKVGLECTDGRMIMPDAFKHQHSEQVPLVWHHGGQKNPENVLGHAILEHRLDGVYAHAFFNETEKAQHAKALVMHGDISRLSIWANKLSEAGKRVMHGTIREVSLVMAGANPGAVIDQVRIRHSDDPDDFTALDDEVIIYTPLKVDVQHAETVVPMGAPKAGSADGETVKDVYDDMSDKQKLVVAFFVGEAINGGSAKHGEFDENELDPAGTGDDKKGFEHMNVFDQTIPSKGEDRNVLSHDDMQAVFDSTPKYGGSLKMAVEEYALQHGIENIDTLFPDAQMVSNTPEFLSRRTEWVSKVLGGARKTPFARIKTITADITMDEARAKGYVTGELKKEEFFSVTKRTTTPQTIYKKQKLDRDDVTDITDFDVVAWLKGEMRIMLDEELARAALIGDGRDISHEDKIQEGNIRPIATDHELFCTKVYVNLDDASSNVRELIEAVILNRFKYKGTGNPTLFTTESVISQILVLKDTLGRRIYGSLSEAAAEMRVSEIVPVEAMEEETEVVAVLVNMIDYAFGTDRGGEVSMFDDFDIDFNQHKFLIETRASGALIKLKSAISFLRVDSTDTLVVPTEPAFNATTGVVTIPTVTGVTYKDEDDVTIAAGAMTAIAAGASVEIHAVPSSGAYYFATSDDDTWTFTRDDA